MLSPIPAGEQASFHLLKVLSQNLPDTGLLTARTDPPRWKLSAPAVLPLGADGHARVRWRPRAPCLGLGLQDGAGRGLWARSRAKQENWL